MVQSTRQLLTLLSLADSFYPEDGGDNFLRNVGLHKTYTAPVIQLRYTECIAADCGEGAHLSLEEGGTRNADNVCCVGSRVRGGISIRPKC
jgi:hypothetical protein